MKRASLKSVKVSVLANPSPDVTDRILKSDGEAKAPTPAPRMQEVTAKMVTADKPKRTRKAAPARLSLEPSPVTSETIESTDAVSRALGQARLALEALNVARDSAEARYNLGIRYRLDSLAHHLEQVTQFVTSQSL